MKNSSLYYLECTCIKDIKFPNVEIHVNDVLYYNPKASSKEMCKYNGISIVSVETAENFRKYCYCSYYLPFTRLKKNARKYKKLSSLEAVKKHIDSKGDFSCKIKEIKVTYVEE